MTGLIVGLVSALIVQLLIIAYLVDQFVRDRAERTEDAAADTKADHAMCIAHIGDLVSDRFVAVALRAYAERFDSITEETTLRKIRASYRGQGMDDSVPAMWMRHHADLLDPPAPEVKEYNMAGQRVL